MNDDVVVVGAGLGGCLAAFTTARQQPHSSVRLLCTRTDRFAYHSGTVDLLGYRPERSRTADKPVPHPVELLDSLPSSHPYRTVGEDGILGAFDQFDEAVGDAYCGLDSDRNALFVGPNGRLGPAFLYPAAMASGKATLDETILLVGFEQVPDFDPRYVSDRLEDRVRCRVDHATIDLPFECTDYPATAEIANRLADAGPDGLRTPGTTRHTEPEWDTFVERLAAEIDVQPRIGVPAVLGRCDDAPLRRALESRLTARVFEVPTGTPSVPGRRLQTRLLSALTDAGVAIETGCEPTGYDAANGHIQSLEVDGTTHEATEFVLATGGIEAGGLVSDRSTIAEPVFECHVDQTDDRSGWFADEFLGDHPYARFGLAVDDAFRPLDADGEHEFDNLRAVGRLVGGFDYTAERSGDGVAIATGYEVGRRLAAAL